VLQHVSSSTRAWAESTMLAQLADGDRFDQTRNRLFELALWQSCVSRCNN
jgi:hypothetical protein